MSCHGNNATAPSPAVAPGVEALNPDAFARNLGRRWPGGVDPRVTALVPGFDAPFFQAGLAGYSDAAMRIVARRQGAPFCVTEALLDRMLLGGGRGFDKADLELLAEALPCGREDQPLSGQIIGSDPDEMAAGALKMIEQAARPDRDYRDLAYGRGRLPEYRDTRWAVRNDGPGQVAGTPPASTPSLPPAFATIDVNLACPVKKIDRKARGGHWLSEPAGAIDILRAVRQAVPRHIPCTVKLRRAYDDTPEMAANFERIFDAAYELGYAWATVHARTVEQKYIGPSRWTFLRDLCRRRPDRVIFGSGDVWEVRDIFRMIAYTGVQAVSVARGCIGNPWIFRQARELLAGREPSAPTIAQQRDALRQHFDLSVMLHGDRHASRMMRKFG
ncbi:MAG: tRNA-dihydrouridine synthase family protein, partial [Phycisphaerae bacterium]|nr:tRNA-dihydrouridine synthase family protein [Phycisphaerae bacterium]